jgi:hypothetical protein
MEQAALGRPNERKPSRSQREPICLRPALRMIEERAKKSLKIWRMCVALRFNPNNCNPVEMCQQAEEGDVLSVTKMWF